MDEGERSESLELDSSIFFGSKFAREAARENREREKVNREEGSDVPLMGVREHYFYYRGKGMGRSAGS